MQEEFENDGLVIDVGALFSMWLNKVWIIALCTILAGGVGFAYCKWAITPQYSSTTSIYVLKNDNDNVTYSDTQLATQLTKDYIQIIMCRTVLEAVIDAYQLDATYDKFKENVSVSNTTDTRMLKITVKDPSPEKAQTLADAVREEASDYILKVMKIEAVSVVDKANLPTAPSEPSKKLWTVAGAMIGFLISIVCITVRFLMDDTIKTTEDIEKYLGLSTLGLVPVMHEEAEKSSVKAETSTEDKSAGSRKRAQAKKKV